jgi:hypothetical protein
MKVDTSALRFTRAAVKVLLQKVVATPSNAEALFKAWPAPETETDQKISGAWGLLAHFCNDVDLRRQDPEYERILLREIQAVIEDL